MSGVTCRDKPGQTQRELYGSLSVFELIILGTFFQNFPIWAINAKCKHF